MADIEKISPDELHLDLKNPRVPDQEFKNETEVLEHLIQNYDIDELVLSILGAGWLDFETFIVLRKGKIVLEGNRRLAALRLIRDEKLRRQVGYTLPDMRAGGPGRAGVDPTSRKLDIPVRYVDSREEAYVFLGFKHINGPFKWKSLAKAKFASEWLETSDADVETISRMLGDSHNTVLRLINGWRVLRRAEDEGFDTRAISGYELSISHIYSALPRPSVREYLGLKSGPGEIIQDDDFPKGKIKNLLQLMTWIYGQEPKHKALVKRQNPDLNTLVRVLAVKSALDELVATQDLSRAASRLTPISERFDVAVREAAKATDDALLLIEGYDGNPVLIDIVTGIGRTALTMRNQMQEQQKSGASDPLASFVDAPAKSRRPK
jgi:hypothetical protein